MSCSIIDFSSLSRIKNLKDTKLGKKFCIYELEILIWREHRERERGGGRSCKDEGKCICIDRKMGNVFFPSGDTPPLCVGRSFILYANSPLTKGNNFFLSLCWGRWRNVELPCPLFWSVIGDTGSKMSSLDVQGFSTSWTRPRGSLKPLLSLKASCRPLSVFLLCRFSEKPVCSRWTIS